MVQQFITNSFAETQQVGENFAQLLDGGDVLLLYGDLGSGKTTFVQGLAKGLGIIRKVNSPTFIVMREYKIVPSPLMGEGQGEGEKVGAEMNSENQDSKIKDFYHIDLYRIETKKEIVSLGLHDILTNPENIVAIEWAEKIKDLLPKKRIEIHFEYLEADKRKIIINR